jgi:Protein of unknown function (DUF1778)
LVPELRPLFIPFFRSGAQKEPLRVHRLQWMPAFDNIVDVAKQQRATRRRLHNTVRKTILSYYSEQEAVMIVQAAKLQKMTISNFVASAALREAESVIRKPSRK